jgi:putative ABC transport system ATP-binding protein
MAIIEIQHVTKTYNTSSVPVQALKDVSLNVERKEFAAIVGPSGSGKTTLLNVIGGLDTVTNGKVLLNGTDITTMNEGKLIDFRLHNIGFVFQAYNLVPVLTAQENVEFVLFLQQADKKDRIERAHELLKRVGLSDQADRKPSELSGGQQQRVAVARALASHPAFVLADEPTANLDSHTAESLLDLMEDLNKEYGTTFLFSTHDAKVIRRARRVITLEDGIIKNDSPGNTSNQREVA